MGLELDYTEVEAVLLADGWYEIQFSSFYVDGFDLGIPGTQSGQRIHIIEHAGGDGFSFIDQNGYRFCGPMSSIHALRFPQKRKREVA